MKLQFPIYFFIGKRLRLSVPITSVADELAGVSSFVYMAHPKKISGSTSTETFPRSRFPNLRRRGAKVRETFARGDRKQKVNDGG